ncbi:acyltransferase family protein [Synechococcus sp. CB0205]|uniref:acyltransferase family protein n=1 Tax=Synechococcus sp. CB0205 TaxID=232363 RepID=UPI0002003182|nr:acyltransferase family protein [Synechococcus sp. CB0205]
MAAASALSTTNKTAPIKSEYRPEIDGLRAFAVVAVIINHFNKDLLPSGYLGVDIFFVISGYVITSSLADRRSKNFLDFVTGFYERRIKRLVPALVVFVLITSVLISLFNPDPDLALETGSTSLFGFSNFYLLKQSTDYFDQSTQHNPFLHTWSLGVEEQFYLLFPLLIWFSGFGQQKAGGARNLFFWVGALTIASLIGFIYIYQVNQPAAYFLMPPRFWEMATGCLIFIAFKKRAKIEQILEQVPPVLIVAAMVGVMFLPVSAGFQATISMVVLSAILIACLKQGTAAYELFTLKKIVYIGLISYSLYLWHWTVLCISRWTVGIHWWSVPIQVLLMFLMAMVSFRFVETPLRRKKILLRRWQDIGVGLVFSAFTSILLLGYAKSPHSSMYLGSRQLDRMSRQPQSKQCNIYADYPEAMKLTERCGMRSFPGRPTVYLLGDSHSSQFSDSIAEYSRHKKFNYITVWGNACHFPAAVVRSGGNDCYDRQRLVEEKVLSLVKKHDVVIIGNALYGYFYAGWGSENKYSTRSGRDLAIDDAAMVYSGRFREVAGKIVSKGGKVVLYVDSVLFPELRKMGYMCKEEWFRPRWQISPGCFHSLKDHLGIIERYFSWRDAWQNGRSKIVWNAYRFGDSCLGDLCNASRYNDRDHFSKEYAAQHFYSFIKENPGLFKIEQQQ